MKRLTALEKSRQLLQKVISDTTVYCFETEEKIEQRANDIIIALDYGIYLNIIDLCLEGDTVVVKGKSDYIIIRNGIAKRFIMSDFKAKLINSLKHEATVVTVMTLQSIY